MRIFIFIALLLSALGASTASFAGNCQHDYDTASDGSRCGDRSADSRPGGN
ncbi:transmembrane anchored protein [Mesorhizobium sp. B3-1-9]|nr:transmembrane anchored protein [Mesorhizobium sp. B3-1-9]